jgi:hypothetical protein
MTKSIKTQPKGSGYLSNKGGMILHQCNCDINKFHWSLTITYRYQLINSNLEICYKVKAKVRRLRGTEKLGKMK